MAEHAAQRLEERGIMEWQVVATLDAGTLVSENRRAQPNPTIEVLGEWPDGIEFKSLWAHIERIGVVKLVTVHFLVRS